MQNSATKNIDALKIRRSNYQAGAQEAIVMTVPTTFILADTGCEQEYEFYLKWINGKGFHVITPDLVEEGYVTGIFSARLYVAMKPNGCLFLLPVTKPTTGHSTTWYEGWQNIIPAAKRGFVTIQVDRNLAQHVYQSKPEMPILKFPDFDYQDLLDQAFEGRVIYSVAELSALEGHQKRESYLPEEDDE